MATAKVRVQRGVQVHRKEKPEYLNAERTETHKGKLSYEIFGCLQNALNSGCKKVVSGLQENHAVHAHGVCE